MKQIKCRLCLAPLDEPVLKLPDTPIANEFLKEKSKQDVFPLQLCYCTRCGHYQLNESISPEILFRQDYPFVTGTSPINVKYFRTYAKEVAEEANLLPDDLVIDIASNDGTVLQHFKEMGMRVLGIEPAQNIAKIATERGIETISEFFNSELAEKIIRKYGRPKLITANNVLAHLPYVIDFIHGVKKLMTTSSTFVFEVSYFTDVFDKMLVDTIYLEHESYYCVTPLVKFFGSQEMTLKKVQRVSPHGGSLRGYVKEGLDLIDPYVYDLMAWEKALMIQDPNRVLSVMDNFQERCGWMRDAVLRKLNELIDSNKKLAIYGYPAKATTLAYILGIKPEWFEFAVEDNPLKCGKYSPGLQIPIVTPDRLISDNIDCCLILAWNFAQSIMDRNKNFKGTWIVPLPNLQVVNNEKIND